MAEHPRLTRIRDVYVTTAIIWLSASVLIALFTGACYIYSWIRLPASVHANYPGRANASALQGLSPSATASLFGAFGDLLVNREYIYQPWVGVSERTFHSSLFNIDDAEPLPIRRTVESPDAAANYKTIWLFGGSTLFGWGAPDDQTIASRLSAILSTGKTHYAVVNHGHTMFYSTQETVLFETLLRHGHKCDIAVFLDGLNDAFDDLIDEPNPTGWTAAGFLYEEDAAQARKYVTVSPFFPPVRVLRGLLGWLGLTANHSTEPQPKAKYDPAAIYRFNVATIQRMAEAQNISVSFFWQPTPYDYMEGSERFMPANGNVPNLNLAVRQEIKDGNFHFIADLFKEEPYKEIYVDSVHYGTKGSRLVAQAIADGLKNEGLLR